jgi:two-component system chemotaxis response regulator CheY
MKALVVEDDEVVRRLLKVFLDDHFDLTITKNGPEALQVFEGALQAGKPFGLVCVDVMMPEMNGVEVLKRLRTIETDFEIYGESCSRVLMVTAVMEKETVAQAFREGCDGYVIKPLERKELLRQLQALKILPAGTGEKPPSTKGAADD